ncbi:MAG: PrsW family intramembrane metalloprotease [Anaerolineales bacterium]|nr:PrsW family intramembrane metalloprotease [Anaerolineales bacterium]
MISPGARISAPPRPAPLHWFSIWQLALSLIAILGLWGLALPSALLGLSTLLSGSALDAVPSFMSAAGLGLAGLLLVPSAGLAFLRILGRPYSWRYRFSIPLWILLPIIPIVFLLGHLVSDQALLAWWLLPLFHGLAIVLPTLWLVGMGVRGLHLGSPQRIWGALAGGLVLAPLLSLVVELALGLFVVVGFTIYLAQDASMVNQLAELSDQIAAANQDPELILGLLLPYLERPAVIGVAFLYGALAVPLIEELFKPVGVWLLARRNLTPGQGFGLGLVSGAGYAIFENIALASGLGADWAAIMFARLGTSAIHVLTTGLLGWGLVLAWRQGRFDRLILAYLGAVALHAAWNGAVIAQALTEILPADQVVPLPEPALALTVVILLACSCVILLLTLNNRFRRAIIPPAAPAQEQPAMIREEDTPIDGNHYLPD